MFRVFLKNFLLDYSWFTMLCFCSQQSESVVGLFLVLKLLSSPSPNPRSSTKLVLLMEWVKDVTGEGSVTFCWGQCPASPLGGDRAPGNLSGELAVSSQRWIWERQATVLDHLKSRWELEWCVTEEVSTEVTQIKERRLSTCPSIKMLEEQSSQDWR